MKPRCKTSMPTSLSFKFVTTETLITLVLKWIVVAQSQLSWFMVTCSAGDWSPLPCFIVSSYLLFLVVVCSLCLLSSLLSRWSWSQFPPGMWRQCVQNEGCVGWTVVSCMWPLSPPAPSVTLPSNARDRKPDSLKALNIVVSMLEFLKIIKVQKAVILRLFFFEASGPFFYFHFFSYPLFFVLFLHL